MKTRVLTFSLIVLALFFVSACKNKSKETPKQETETPKQKTETPENFVKASEPQQGETIGKNASKYEVIPERSKVRWQAKRPDSGNYKGSIKVNQGVFLMEGKRVGAAKIAFQMGSLRVENVDVSERRVLQAKILGLVQGKSGWGFSVNDDPFGVVEIIKEDQKEGQTLFTINLMLKGTLKTIKVPGEVSFDERKELTIRIKPFSINRETWAIAFDNDNLMGKYILFDMVFKAKAIESRQ